MALEVVILAAGQGTRMRSDLPKVLHPIAGKPMLVHVIDATRALGAARVHVVVGHGAGQVRDAVAGDDLNWVIQAEQLGTGHAVAQALPQVADDAVVLVAYGDVPLVAAATLQGLVDAVDRDTLALLTVELDDPTGYGRILRDQRGEITAIVEQKDASPEQLAVGEVNTGILAVDAARLKRWLPELSADNAQGEYYLTDIIVMAVAEGMRIDARHPDHVWEVHGVNNRLQQSELERICQWQRALALMEQGVTLLDPGRLDVRGSLVAGRDVTIDINCVFIGDVTLGDGVTVDPNCVIENTTIGAGVHIKANTVIEDAIIGERCDIGPFARIRPGSRLSDGVKVGNFVETKKALIGTGSKVNHLSYVGDTDIGENVNVGAGTITCNYDGVNKFKTIIGDGCFIGSNTALVAPVTLGDNVTIGAGSTITEDVSADQLAVARGRQRNIDSWERPAKKD